MKFRVGDRVKVVPRGLEAARCAGKEGEVVKVFSRSCWPYKVNFGGIFHVLSEADLELAQTLDSEDKAG